MKCQVENHHCDVILIARVARRATGTVRDGDGPGVHVSRRRARVRGSCCCRRGPVWSPSHRATHTPSRASHSSAHVGRDPRARALTPEASTSTSTSTSMTMRVCTQTRVPYCSRRQVFFPVPTFVKEFWDYPALTPQTATSTSMTMHVCTLQTRARAARSSSLCPLLSRSSGTTPRCARRASTSSTPCAATRPRRRCWTSTTRWSRSVGHPGLQWTTSPLVYGILHPLLTYSPYIQLGSEAVQYSARHNVMISALCTKYMMTACCAVVFNSGGGRC
jgi:hypothetical protein